MTVTYSGEEYTYDNLGDIGYESDKLSVDYSKFYYVLYVTDNEVDSSVCFDENYVRYFDKISNNDTLKLTEKQYSKITKTANDGFELTEKAGRSFVSEKREDVVFSETAMRHITSTVKEDTIYFIATITDSKGNTTQEGDEYGVMFDFELFDRELSSDKFSEWVNDECPIGYNPLRPFVPGEYEYKNAYAGFKLSINPLYGKFGVTSNIAYVDVEDTVEKGNSEAKVGELKSVEFDKTFYTTPQIQCQVVYAQENCYAVVPEISKTGFKFGIKSLKTGNYIGGEINWMVDGY